MLMNNRAVVVGLILAGFLWTGCSQIRKSNRTSANKNHLANMVIKNEELDTSVCSRGMFILAAHKDLTTGQLRTNGRGYVTTKPMKEPDPYYHLKLGLKPKDPKATEPPEISRNLGPRLEISLGQYAVSSAPAVQGDFAMALSAMQSEAGIEEASKAKKLVLGWDPKLHAYFSAANASPLEPLASSQASRGADTATAENETEDLTRAQATMRGGVGTVRSFVFGLKDENAAVAANLPNDITHSQMESGLVKGVLGPGKTLDIPILDSEIPRNAQGMVTVLIEEAAEKPTWRAFYYERDDDGTKTMISIPTTGNDVGNKAYALKEGPVRLVVSRQIMTTHELAGPGGSLCIVTGAGITTYGDLGTEE